MLHRQNSCSSTLNSMQTFRIKNKKHAFLKFIFFLKCSRLCSFLGQIVPGSSLCVPAQPCHYLTAGVGKTVYKQLPDVSRKKVMLTLCTPARATLGCLCLENNNVEY